MRFALLTTALCLSSFVFADSQQIESKITSPLKWELTPQFSIMSPSDFRLSTDRLIVPYGKSLGGLPMASVGMNIPVGTLADLQFHHQTRVGYGYKSDKYSVDRRVGPPIESEISLHWVPVSTGMRLVYEIPGFPYLKPGLVVGAGMNWFLQRTNLTELNQSYLVPFLFTTPMLTFLEGKNPTDWFGGFTFGVTYQHSLGNQPFRGFAVDLGLTVLL